MEEHVIKTGGRLEDVSDAPSRKRILTLHPAVRQSAIDAFLLATASLSGKNLIRITYGLRTFAEQDKLYNKGRRNGVKVGATMTNAKGGQSYHNYGLALDFVLIHLDGKASWNTLEDMDRDGIADWLEVANAFKLHGWEWGGDWNSFKDRPHVQKTFGINWRQLLPLYNAGKRDADGYVIIPGRE
jgi:peptidoglycan L-alanyl-D-glutamate endopeptidase CwlK